MTTSMSIGPPSKPPCASGTGNAVRPSSANAAQCASDTPVSDRHDRLARFEPVALVEIAAQRVGELLLFVVEIEVHAPLLTSPRIICAMMFF